MGMPVAQMFDFVVLVLDFPENLFLVFTILKKTHRGAPCLRAGLDDAGDVDVQFVLMLLICADDAAARFVLIEAVALVKNGNQRGFWYNEAYLVGRVGFHWASPLLH